MTASTYRTLGGPTREMGNDVVQLAVLVVIAAAVVLTSIAAQRHSWRRQAFKLYRGQAAIWASDPRWVVVDTVDSDLAQTGASATLAHEIQRLGFTPLGCIQDATDRGSAAPRDERVMRIFLGDGGTTWAATYEMSGYRVLEFETEFSDGFVVGTGNNELAGRLTWPPEFDVRHEAFESAPSLLVEKHRQRVRTRLAQSPQSLLRVCDTLLDVVASQNRQQRTKHAFRRSIGYLSEDEFRGIASDVRLSRRAAKAIFTEYGRLAKEAASATGRPTTG